MLAVISWGGGLAAVPRGKELAAVSLGKGASTCFMVEGG